MKRKLGDILADMILFGDVEEAVWPEAWIENQAKHGEMDHEQRLRSAIAATLLKLTNGGEGGSCSDDDEMVAPYLRQEVEVDDE